MRTLLQVLRLLFRFFLLHRPPVELLLKHGRLLTLLADMFRILHKFPDLENLVRHCRLFVATARVHSVI